MRWYDSIFIGNAIQGYVIPEIFEDYLRPHPGYRGALGLEYKRCGFALEAGYTRIEGTNPLVLDVSLAPLVFKFTYGFPSRWRLGLQGGIALGALFSQTAHYDTSLNMLAHNTTYSDTNSLFAGARLYLVYSFQGNFLKLYAGGGVDALFEDDGAIPMPTLEAGISLKPFMFVSAGRRRLAKIRPEPKISPEEIVFSHTLDNFIVQETEAGKTVRILNAVYFEANSVNMIERYRPILNYAGERLRADPELRMTLRAYAAPFGTAEGQTAVSAARAWFCVEYYMKRYGIAENRMKIEYYGAEKTPEELRDASWESYRCVELILEERRES